MLNGGFERVGIILVGAYVAFNEWRHKNSVSSKRFQDFQTASASQMNRIESHVWDIMKDRGITPTQEIPDEIKNQR